MDIHQLHMPVRMENCNQIFAAGDKVMNDDFMSEPIHTQLGRCIEVGRCLLGIGHCAQNFMPPPVKNVYLRKYPQKTPELYSGFWTKLRQHFPIRGTKLADKKNTFCYTEYTEKALQIETNSGDFTKQCHCRRAKMLFLVPFTLLYHFFVFCVDIFFIITQTRRI